MVQELGAFTLNANGWTDSHSDYNAHIQDFDAGFLHAVFERSGVSISLEKQ